MPASNGTAPDLTIVGAGVIGMAVAWRCAQLGMSVRVLEREQVGLGASHAAAGMLAPAAEAEFGLEGQRLVALALASAALWPAFATELEAQSAVPVGLRRCGTLSVARDQDEARELERQLALRESLGVRALPLRPSQARAYEPALAPTIRLAMESPDDHSVDPRLVMLALRSACEREGVDVRERAPVERVLLDHDGRRVAALAVESEELPCERLLLATGAWTARLAGLPAGALMPVRPVKGQIMRLRDPAGPGLLERVVRFERGYFVPRGDGRYVLGATMEDVGFDTQPTVAGIDGLLRGACELVPGAAELEIDEIAVGLRPCLPDNLPAIGFGALDGLVWATGHHRNGVLLAPLTAALIADLLTTGAEGEGLSVCDPARFAAPAPGRGAAGSRAGALAG